MSTFTVTIEQIKSIHPHPSADRLEIAKVLGTQTIVTKGAYKEGDKVTFFPPDLLIDPKVAVTLGVANYLKHADYKGERCQCRVAAVRLRGIPSYGFVIPGNGELGSDVSTLYGAVKYQPPEPKCMDIERDHPLFHTYTSIEHYWKYPDLLVPGEQVYISEKLHGTSSRLGYIATDLLDTPYKFMAGSHYKPLKQGNNLYWQPMELVKDLLIGQGHSAILFGEIYGPKVQDLDYGENVPKFRAFDLSINGQYVDYYEFEAQCDKYCVPTVPVIYEGPFDPDLVEGWTHGPTLLRPSKKFKGREGVVIKPVTERQTIYGRTILKSVSADYLAR